MKNRPRVLAIIALALTIASAYAFQPSLNAMLPAAIALMLLGGIALGLSVWLDSQPARVPVLPIPAKSSTVSTGLNPTRWKLFAVGLLFLALLSEVNGKVLGLPPLDTVTSNAQFWMLGIGIALVTLGLGGTRRSFRRPIIHWPETLALLAITLLALALRFWQLETSVRFFVDELNFANAIQDLWLRDQVEILRPLSTVAPFPYVFPFLQLQGVEIFGRSFLGLRAASAVLGALGIPALYLLAKTLFDRKTALIAALLLASFPPHLHFSRLGMNNIADPLVGILALAFLAGGVMYGRRFDYVVGAALLGLTHYFYEGGRLLFTPLAVVWLLGLLFIWRSRLHKQHLLMALLAALIVALPVYYTLIGTGNSLAARAMTQESGLSIGYWQHLFESGDFAQHFRNHIAPAFLVHTHLVDKTGYYLGDTALVLAVMTPALLLGLGYVLLRWRSPGPLLLILWLLSVSLGNSLLDDSARPPRFVLVFPALMLLAAVGIRYTLPLIWPERPAAKLQSLLLSVFTITLAVTQTNFYFNWHLPLFEQQTRENLAHRDAQDAVLRSLDFPPGTYIHIISEVAPDQDFTSGVLRFMSDDLELETVASKDFTLAYIAGLRSGVDHAFYVDPEDLSTLRLLRENFDLWPPQTSPYGLPLEYQFVLYYSPNANTQ